MNVSGWPEVRAGRLGAGVVLEAGVVWTLRVGEETGHERVGQRVIALAESGLPLVVSYLSLVDVASRVQAKYGLRQANQLLSEAREIFNIVLPTAEDVQAAEDVLAQEVERLTIEQAVVGAVARRLGCSVYGYSPAYHFFHVAVVMD